MRILKMAIKSLRVDFIKSLFYFMAFTLTTIFIFSFFNVAFNPASGIHLGSDDTSLVTTVAVLVIVVAMMCVFLANDFYVSNKSLDISIMLMSGASVYKTGLYLFFQSLIIMALAIPLGLVISYSLLPILNIIFQNLFVYQQTIFFINQEAIIATAIILGFEVGWCTLLNIGYCYRSTITGLLKENHKIEWYGIEGKRISSALYLILYLLPFILFLVNEDVMGFLMISLIGTIGVYGLIKHIIPSIIIKAQKNSSLENSKQLITLGFYKYTLQKVNVLALTMVISSMLLMSMIIYTMPTPLVSMITLISYGSVMVLLSLTILFKVAMQLVKRKQNTRYLLQLGFIKKDIKKIMLWEMCLFYGTLLLFPLAYQICILLKLLYLQQITVSLVLLLLSIQILPIISSGFICVILYHKLLPK